MHWGSYIACFFSGMFLANTVPHLTKGLCGDAFPTPFAKPPGKGLSSAPVNTIWALFNAAIGCLLFHTGHIASGDPVAIGVFALGIVLLSVQMSNHFQHKDAK